MNTDTPETDAHLLGGSYSFDASFARKLERQRNKAIDECIALRQMVRELRDALQLATDECLWRSDSEIPLSPEDSQRIYSTAVVAIEKANQLLP